MRQGLNAFAGGGVKIWGLKGLLALAGALTLLPGTAQAAWLQAKSRHFTIMSDGSESKLREFAEKLEKFDGLLRHVTGITDPEAGSPVHVYLLSNDAKVRALTRNANIGGFYTTSDRFAYAVLARGMKASEYDMGAEDILFHEYTHHFMLHHFPAAYPAWYVEGFAEFFSIVKFPKDGSIQFGLIPMARAPTLVQDSPYPLKNLFVRDTDGLGLRDGDRYYGTAWLLTHYYQYKADRRAEISHYLKDLTAGVPDMKLDGYFAGGIDGLEKDLKAYMRRPLAASKLIPQAVTVGEIAIGPVDAARGALVEDELRLMHRPTAEELPEIVSAIRATAAKFPSSAYAAALLAEAEWKAEEKDASLADADRAIALDPGLSRAYSSRARVLLERAQDDGREEDWKAARTAIVKANRADTEDPVPLTLFYRYHAMKGGPMPEIGYDGLAKAYVLLPQRPEYRMAYVQALAFRGEYAAASRLLDPLAYSPHPSGMRDSALELKKQYDAEAAKKGASAAP
ncbi:hypothetical protein ACFFV8_07270 [Sphingobium indicum]|uniref:hypothetical protein n=1 Tax=Sphingobium TaxID=165695 RepID=UPI000684CA19|nr:hypothetical protein [Sphingobium sp. HDIP04]